MSQAQSRGGQRAVDHDHHDDAHGAHEHFAAAASPPTGASVVTDPVCGMTVDPQTSKHRFEYQGQTFHFCSARCRERFAAEPGKYLQGAEAAPAPAAPPGTIWTCPMHPQIRQDHPGACPICGMTLEPLAPTTEAGKSAELADMRRRFWSALALTVPVVVLAMGVYVPAVGPMIDRLVPRALSGWIQLVLTTPIVLWAGSFFFTRAWRSVVNRSLNMFSLIALGVGTAYVYSVVAALAPASSPADSAPPTARWTPISRPPQ